VSGHAVLPGLWPVHGDGVLARQGDLVLLVHPAGGSFTDRLLDLLADAALTGRGGRRFTDLISAEFDAHAASAIAPDHEPAPAAVAFGPAGGGIALTLYGTAWAEVTTTHGTQRLTAGQPYGRLGGILPSSVVKVRAGVRAVVDDGGTDRYLRLADGVVRAVALVYSPDNASPDRTAESMSVVAEAEPVVAEPGFISVSFVDDEAGSETSPRNALPLGAEPPDQNDLGIAAAQPPLVVGAYCKNGHFDDPEARYCAVCGIGMAQQTRVPRPGKRPPLGVLVLDDGSVFSLETDYVIGREPSLDASVANGSARPLRLVDVSGLVSRIHARVELDGWQVYVCDLNSANGTELLLPGEKDATRLAPGVRTRLVLGAQVRLGSKYGFRYDSHRHR
jgi:FHA domain